MTKPAQGYDKRKKRLTKMELSFIEAWKLKKKLEFLESVKPVGSTSIITLLIRPEDSTSRIRTFLNEELGKATNIKSAQNRSCVQEGLRSLIDFIKLYSKPPANGLVCFFASAIIDATTNKEKKFKMYFEPPKPMLKFVYHCSNKVLIEPLKEMLTENKTIGYIVIDGKGAVFAKVTGNERLIMNKFSVNLPKKHHRGGQSAARFARIREECRNNFLLDVCRRSCAIFITNDKPNVEKLVLAGQAQLKEELEKCPHFDPRLKQIVCLVLTVAYGNTKGLDEAIKLSSETISNVRLHEEISLLSLFMEFLKNGKDDLVSYGIKSTLMAFDEGAVDTLIIWQELDYVRWQLSDQNTLEDEVLYLRKGKTPSNEKEVIEAVPLIEWLLDHALKVGVKLELVSDKSQEGAMFVRGFSGVGALLRFARNEQQYGSECEDNTAIQENSSSETNNPFIDEYFVDVG